MPFLELARGQPLHYEDLGHGPPIVLVHGWAMSTRSLAPLAEALAPDHRVISVDLRGHGLSHPQSGYGLEDLSGDVEALFKALRLERAVLAGWSMGAQIAVAAAPRLGRRVRALALLSGTARFTCCDGYTHGLPEREVEGLSSRLARSPAKALARFAAAMLAEGDAAPAERTALAAALVSRPPDRNAALRTLETLARTDLRPLLPSLRLPALVLHGERDAICPAGASRYMAERIGEATLIVLEGAGHAPSFTRPAEVARRVHAFAEAA